MTRVFVHVEWRPEIDPEVTEAERDEQWAALLAPLVDRASALGGRISGWGPRSLLVDFSWDGLYDAVDFLVDAPLAPELAAGLCHGDPRILSESGRLAIMVGEPVRLARDLSALARPGEVLVSPAAVEKSNGKLGTTGTAGKRTGRPDVPALILDPLKPLTDSFAPLPPSSRNTLDLIPTEHGSTPPSQAPESLRALQVDRLITTTQALGDTAPAGFPTEAGTMMRKRDEASLRELAEMVRRNSGEEAGERLDAMAQLAGGKSGEALRRLRRSKEKAQADDPSACCRAALALGVALASAGRPYEAALEGLEGIARARQAQDQRGERACARFLSQLAVTFKDEASAAAWAQLGM